MYEKFYVYVCEYYYFFHYISTKFKTGQQTNVIARCFCLFFWVEYAVGIMVYTMYSSMNSQTFKTSCTIFKSG